MEDLVDLAHGHRFHDGRVEAGVPPIHDPQASSPIEHDVA